MTITKRTYWGLALLGVLAIAAVAVTVTSQYTFAGGDSEEPISGTALEKASAAALAHTGEGRVTDTEVGDEESYYEVEVTLDNGSQVDVQLDESFNVVGESADVEAPGDDDGQD
jgi:hypothetical protein